MQIDAIPVLILAIPVLMIVYKLGQLVEARRMRRRMGRHSDSMRILEGLRGMVKDEVRQLSEGNDDR